jgi:hypothetical protein
MKIRTKSILSAVCLVAGLALLNIAQAETVPTSMGITNSFAFMSTNTSGVGNAIKVDNNDNVGLQITGQGDNVGTSNIVLRFVRSGDGTGYETNSPLISWTFAQNGTKPFCYYTNLNNSVIGAAQWLKLYDYGSNSTNATTNVVLKIIIKRIRP